MKTISYWFQILDNTDSDAKCRAVILAIRREALKEAAQAAETYDSILPGKPILNPLSKRIKQLMKSK